MIFRDFFQAEHASYELGNTVCSIERRVIVNYEFERLRNEMVSAVLWSCPSICVRLLRNATKLCVFGEQFVGRDSNACHPEFEARFRNSVIIVTKFESGTEV